MRFHRASSSGAPARAVRVVLAAALMLSFPRPSRAGQPIVEPYATQPSAGSGTRGWIEVGQATIGEYPPVTQVGFRVGSMTPARPGFDLALSVWVLPVSVLSPDADLAVPIEISPGARFVPRVGASALIAGGEGSTFVATGANAGLGLVIGADSPVSFRVDYSARVFRGTEISHDAMHVLTAGIGWGGSKTK